MSIELENLPQLMRLATDIRQQLRQAGITGAAGAEIDHVELFGAPLPCDQADARNFVLCPGEAYDRSPCGTGTSAKVACLAAAGQLAPGSVWRQASVIGSRFDASYELLDEDNRSEDDRGHNARGHAMSTQGPLVRVSLVGSAHVIAESELILDPNDPFCMGIQA